MLYPKENSKRKKRYGIYECPICFNHFKTGTDYVKRKNGNCSCRDCYKKFNGESNTRIYNIWRNMNRRCYVKNHKNYNSYGGRGIAVCKEWTDYFTFKSWATQNGYNKELTIDRINNDGNYEPSNCRWATRAVQSRNTRRIHKDNTSGFRGVSYNKRNNNYMTRISVKGKSIYLGSYDSKVEAAVAYDDYIITNKLEHTRNFYKHCNEL